MAVQAVRDFLTKHAKKGQKKPEHSETTNLWFKLPRELRDLIYREALCKRYLIHRPTKWKKEKAFCNDDKILFKYRDSFWTWSGNFCSGHVWTVKRRTFWADVALLLTSKAICQEAIEMMYKESSFCVHMGDHDALWWSRTTPLPSWQLSRIQNLEVDTCVCATLDYRATETWFHKFNASDDRGNSCRISFPCYRCLMVYAGHKPLFKASQFLLGFKTVTITLEQQRKDKGGKTFYLERYNSKREALQAALEPYLGPGRSYNIGNLFCLEFHPRKYLEKLLAAEPNSGA